MDMVEHFIPAVDIEKIFDLEGLLTSNNYRNNISFDYLPLLINFLVGRDHIIVRFLAFWFR